jgi:hypothetical protein
MLISLISLTCISLTITYVLLLLVRMESAKFSLLIVVYNWCVSSLEFYSDVFLSFNFVLCLYQINKTHDFTIYFLNNLSTIAVKPLSGTSTAILFYPDSQREKGSSIGLNKHIVLLINNSFIDTSFSLFLMPEETPNRSPSRIELGNYRIPCERPTSGPSLLNLGDGLLF